MKFDEIHTSMIYDLCIIFIYYNHKRKVPVFHQVLKRPKNDAGGLEFQDQQAIEVQWVLMWRKSSNFVEKNPLETGEFKMIDIYIYFLEISWWIHAFE